VTPYGPYLELKLFLRVVELGTIRAAARESGLEPSSVSRRLTNLESRLGTKLLERAQARSHPTEAGRQFYDRLRVLLSQIEGLEAEVSGEADTPRGLLRVTATLDFGQIHVTDWILNFKRAYPETDVELNLSARNVDLVSAGIDVAIRVGEQPDSALMARKLADVPRVLVAAPDYLARHGTPTTPDDLTRHDHVFFLPEYKHRPLRLKSADGKVHEIPRHGGVTINAVMSVVEAVRRGFGVHLGPRWAYHDALKAGDVVEILPGYSHEAMPMTALWAPAVFVPARVRAFIDFVAGRIHRVEGLDPV